MGSEWEGSMEEKRLEVLAVRGNRRLLYAKHCKGRSFIFLFSLSPSLSLLFIPYRLLLSPFCTHCFVILHTNPLFMFMLLLFLVWSLVLAELNSGEWNSSFFFIPPHIPLEDCLGKEVATLHLVLSVKLVAQQVFCPLYLPCPK